MKQDTKETIEVGVILGAIIALLVGSGIFLGAHFFPKEVLYSAVEKECEDLGGRLGISLKYNKKHECVKREVLFTK